MFKTQNASRSVLGAPSQHNQSSRKGKRAWRKNVSIEDVETGLENIRAEERSTGTALQKIQDVDLFHVDLKGDDNIRKSLPRYSSAQLTSTKILAQRSAVPAVVSRISTSKKRKSEEKVSRMAKRLRQGPLDSPVDSYSVLDPSSVTSRTKPRESTKLSAVREPHPGASYNPPAEAHHDLLLKASSIEQKRVTEAAKLAEVKTRKRVTDDLDDTSLAPGMTVQETGDQDEKAADSYAETRAAPTPKTKAQRNKQARLSAEKRALTERIQKRRLINSVNEAKSIRRATMMLMIEREQSREQRRRATMEKLEKQGFAGMKVGKHKVPEPDFEVQLGEDLSGSLRGLKTEGNLFRDRFQSLQQRGLVEPRVRLWPKRRRHRLVEYEKHAWKKFE